MSPPTHIAAGVCLTLACYKLNPTLPIFDILPGVLATTNWPDVDQKFKCLRHRGQTHSLLWPIVFIFLAWYTGHYVFVGATIGHISHLVLDLCNGKGIEAIWPLSDKNYRIAKLKYEGVMEYMLLGGMLAGSVGLIVTMFIK